MRAVAAAPSVIRDHGGASSALVPAVTPLTATLPPLVPNVPESPSKRRQRLAARRRAGESLQQSPEPTRRKRPDGDVDACAGLEPEGREPLAAQAEERHERPRRDAS
jgi:hypothetical protein